MDIRIGTDERTLAAAHTFYHRYSTKGKALTPGSDVQDELRLMPVGRAVTDGWFSGDDRVTVTAWEGDELIGLASGVCHASGACGYLSYICVAPAYRRRGVATQLVSRVLDEARKRGYRIMMATVISTNTPSLRLHESLGYERMSTLIRGGQRGGKAIDLVLMKRVLQ